MNTKHSDKIGYYTYHILFYAIQSQEYLIQVSTFHSIVFISNFLLVCAGVLSTKIIFTLIGVDRTSKNIGLKLAFSISVLVYQTANMPE